MSNRNDVDDEWDKFILSYNNDSDESCEDTPLVESNINIALNKIVNILNNSINTDYPFIKNLEEIMFLYLVIHHQLGILCQIGMLCLFSQDILEIE